MSTGKQKTMKALMTTIIMFLGVYEQEGRFNEIRDWDEVREIHVERQFRWYLRN